MYYRDHDKGADLRPRSKSQKHLSHYWGEFLPAEGEGLEQTERGLIIRGASLGTALANEQMGGGGWCGEDPGSLGPGSREGGPLSQAAG